MVKEGRGPKTFASTLHSSLCKLCRLRGRQRVRERERESVQQISIMPSNLFRCINIWKICERPLGKVRRQRCCRTLACNLQIFSLRLRRKLFAAIVVSSVPPPLPVSSFFSSSTSTHNWQQHEKSINESKQQGEARLAQCPQLPCRTSCKINLRGPKLKLMKSLLYCVIRN